MNFQQPGPPPNMGMQMQHYSEVPTVRIAGASAGVPGIAYEVLAPNGLPMAKLEVYPLSMGLPPSGPVREGFARPSIDEHRRRAASVSNGSEYDYHAQYFGNGQPRHLIDRIQQTPDLMSFHSHRFSNNNTPVPPLTRSDVTNSSGTNDGGFSRPHSRVSNASTQSHRSNAYGPINYAQTRGGARHEPYSQAGSRPFSANSNRSQNSFRSNGTSSVRLQKDTYYPRYNGNERDGTYERLPAERIRPFFTPLLEAPIAGITCRNLVAGTTLEDVYSSFGEYGPIDTVEFLEEYKLNGVDVLAVMVIFHKKDDADRATEKLNGCEADGQVLEVLHCNPNIFPRPFAHSTDPEKHRRFDTEPSMQIPQVKAEPRPAPPRTPVHGDEDVAMSTGSRTPAMSTGSRTPAPASNGSKTPRPETSSSQQNGTDGWGSHTTTNGTAAAANGAAPSITASDGWGQPETAPPPADNSGWGSTDAAGWR